MPFNFEHVPGFFHTDVLAPAISAEEALGQSFGLLDTSPERWEKLKARLEQLNAEGLAEGASYKLLWFGRHGQGYHNVAEVQYTAEGTWQEKWSHETTDGTITWGPDARLTPLGESQAQALRSAWVVAAKEGVPLPTRWITSPLQRTCQTCIISWGGVWSEVMGKGKDGEGVDVEVIETLREKAWYHTCDKRRPKSVAMAQFPHLRWPDSMPEEDELWKSDEHETDENTWKRITNVLEEIWKSEDTYVSMTGHADIMRACFYVTGHPVCPISTGQLVPQVVRRVKI